MRTKEFKGETKPYNFVINDDNIEPLKAESAYLAFQTLDTFHFNDTSDKFNLTEGFKKRIAPRHNIPELYLRARLQAFVYGWCRSNLTPLPEYNDEERDRLFAQWTSENNYTQKRNAHMAEYYNDFKQNGLRNKDYVVKSFIKSECYDEVKQPRYINSRTDKFKAVVGSWTHLIEKEVFRTPYFIKGHDPKELPTLLKRLEGKRNYYATDYSSFESSFSEELTQVVEQELWEYMLVNNKDICNIFRKAYGVQIIESKQYHARISGTRMSGEMWTSLGNGFTNLMLMLFYAESMGINIDGYVEGDDGIFATDDDYDACPINISNFMASYGFDLKIDHYNCIEECRFCQNAYSPVTGTQYVTLRHIAKTQFTFNKADFNSRKFTSNKHHLLKVLKCKLLSLKAVGGSTPVIYYLSRSLLSKLSNIKLNGRYKRRIYKELQFKIRHDSVREPNLIDFIEYQHMFGVSVSEQINIIDYMKTYVLGTIMTIDICNNNCEMIVR